MSTRITRSVKKASTHPTSKPTSLPAPPRAQGSNVAACAAPTVAATTLPLVPCKGSAQFRANTTMSMQRSCPSKVITLSGAEQVVGAITPRTKPRKRTSSESNLNVTAAAGQLSGDQVGARAIKKAKCSAGPTGTERSLAVQPALTLTNESNGAPVRKTPPKPRPVSRAKIVDAQGDEAALVKSSTAEAPASKATKRLPGVRKGTTVPHTDHTVITDPVAEVADHDDELSNAASDSDHEGVDPNDQDIDGGRDSDSDLEEVEPEKLGQQLTAEQPVWIEVDDALSIAPSATGGQRQVRDTQIDNNVPQLDLDGAFESEHSDSEVQPELLEPAAHRDDDDTVEYEGEAAECEEDIDDDEMSVDQGRDGDASEADELRAAVPTRRKTDSASKQANGKKTATGTVDGRRALEHPVWKDKTTSNTSTTHITTSTPQCTTQSSVPLRSEAPSHTAGHDTDAGLAAATLLTHNPAPLTPASALGSAEQSANNLPPEAYSVVLPAKPSAALSLTAQHPHVQETCRACFVQSELDLVFDNAFPDGLVRTQFVANGLVTAADSLGYPGLSRRYQVDEEFFRQVSSIAKQWISTFRGAIKKVAQAHVVAHYSLSPNDCTEKINWMFEDLIYVYPFTYEPPKRIVSWSKPYLHPAIISILRQCFFAGSSSIGFKYASRFVSSLPERPHEKEIPMPMLALVGTAIHACLMDWKHGSFKSTAFTSDAYLDPYNEHMTLLQGIKNASARGYHHVAHELYCIASGASAKPVAATTSAASALAHVDFANMDID